MRTAAAMKAIERATGARGIAAGAFALAACLAAVAGCSGPVRFVHPEADIPYYERVGIVPFTPLGTEPASGRKVSDVFFIELLRLSEFEVVEPGQFAAAMQRVRGGTPPENPWSTEEIARLGDEAQVEGIFFGAVRDFEMERVNQEAFPVISIDARFVDAASGRVVWSANRTRRGGPGVPLLGWFAALVGSGEVHTLGQLTSEMCHELLETFPREK